MLARIYKPAKTAMQSGTAASERWVLEYEPEALHAADYVSGLDLLFTDLNDSHNRHLLSSSVWFC